MSTSTPRSVASGSDVEFDPEAPWRLHSAVAVRPEPFGALLYHFDTRRLTFLKDRRLLEVVSTLEWHATARATCAAAGIAPAEQASFERALQNLAATSMIITRPDEEPET